MKTQTARTRRYDEPVSESQLGPLVATLYELQSVYLEPKLKAVGIRWTTFQLLAAVLGAGDEASQAEIARRLGVAPATLSEAVHNHVRLGLLTQEAADGDRRKKILKLTALGKRKMSGVAVHVQELERLLTGTLSSEVLRQTEAALEKMVTNLENSL